MGHLSLDEVHLDELLSQIVKAGCREFYLRIGRLPYTCPCVTYPLGELSEYKAPGYVAIQQMIYAILTDDQIRQFERQGKLAFSYAVRRTASFDVRLTRSQGNLEADFQIAPDGN